MENVNDQVNENIEPTIEPIIEEVAEPVIEPKSKLTFAGWIKSIFATDEDVKVEELETAYDQLTDQLSQTQAEAEALADTNTELLDEIKAVNDAKDAEIKEKESILNHVTELEAKVKELEASVIGTPVNTAADAPVQMAVELTPAQLKAQKDKEKQAQILAWREEGKRITQK